METVIGAVVVIVAVYELKHEQQSYTRLIQCCTQKSWLQFFAEIDQMCLTPKLTILKVIFVQSGLCKCCYQSYQLI